MADVLYTYRKCSFEQDVVLREQPPSPADFGLNPDTTQLEVLTEFINPPAADVTATSDGTDENISWGAMQISHGQAFDVDTTDNPSDAISVQKRYVNYQGRTILMELVP